MKLEKGLYRITLQSGLVAFGEIKEIEENQILFQGFSPSAVGKKIPIGNIVIAEKWSEEDVPAYE